MTAVVVIGAQWGDEGKGKIVDLLTPEVDVVVRFQGGANAGHTLVVDGQRTVFHLLPSGVLHPHGTCVIGNGVVLDPEVALREIAACRTLGLDLAGRLFVSISAHVVLPQHQQIDLLREVAAGDSGIGTTKRGIGPAYEAKIGRRGLVCGDLVNPDRLQRRLHEILPELNRYIEIMLGGKPAAIEKTIEQYVAYGNALQPFVTDTVALLHEGVRAGKRILLEGAQGTALDVDHGTYPYVTSSTTVAAGAASGSGLGPTALTHVIGVAKAYCTRVGAGPFPTELTDDMGARLQERGHEFGSTTGRPRRCGWLDAVALRRAAQINGFTHLALTKVDVLESCETVRIGVGYRLRGQPLTTWPMALEDLAAVEPLYESLPGWKNSCRGVTSAADLPAALRHFLSRLEILIGVPVGILSYGPDRRDHVRLARMFD
ncbi:MAG: adenylosuccinate synthase [Deltaproteobacteria bacterium]|nr:adenylosuccinate synthase [Deltaproteobacteria bacterium]